MVTAVLTQGGFDSTSSATSQAVALSWLEARYQEMCAESGYTQAIRELGPTVVDQDEYALPESVTRVVGLRVGTSRPWTPVKLDDLWALSAGTARLEGGMIGAFAETWSEETADAGTEKVKLYPAPTEAALDVLAICVVSPPALSLSANTAPRVPTDFHEYIVDGAIAMGLRRDDSREDEAAPYEARFKDAIGRLGMRRRKRVGRGPIQGRVASVHF